MRRPRPAVPPCASRCVELGVPLVEHGGAAGEEGVLRGPEPLPQRVIGVLGRAAGSLPLHHQLLVAGRRRTPVGRLDKALGLLDQLLLAGACRGPGAVQVGEVRAAPTVERVPRLGEPLPELFVGLAVDALDRLPLVQDLAQPVARGLPLRRLGRDLLGLVDQRLFVRDGLGPGRLPGRLAGGHGLLGPHDQVVDPGGKRREVTDDGGVRERVPQMLGRGQCLLRIAVAGLQSGVEQFALGAQVVEPPCEVGEALGRFARLPRTHGAFAVGRSHVDGAVRVDPTPPVRMLFRGRRCRRGDGFGRRVCCRLFDPLPFDLLLLAQLFDLRLFDLLLLARLSNLLLAQPFDLLFLARPFDLLAVLSAVSCSAITAPPLPTSDVRATVLSPGRPANPRGPRSGAATDAAFYHARIETGQRLIGYSNGEVACDTVIIRAVTVPHPPLLVPELVGGARTRTEPVRVACVTAARKLADVADNWVAIAADPAGPMTLDPGIGGHSRVTE